MLDQNTDRMWFVIGAVIVGAAIIFIANGTLPTLFASVSDSFEESSNKGIEVIEDITVVGENLFVPSTITPYVYTHQNNGELRNDSNGTIFSSSDWIEIEPGRTYVFETPEESRNKRIVYYDADRTYIRGGMRSGNYKVYESAAPGNAAYARISTVSEPSSEVNKHQPVDTWVFRAK